MKSVVSALLLFSLARHAEAAEVLAAVNARRAAIGLYALQPDPTLQHWAERKAQMQATRGHTGHIYRGAWPGKREGTGNRSGADPQGRHFLACNMATGHPSGRWGHHRFAGAAAVVARGKTFYCLILK